MAKVHVVVSEYQSRYRKSIDGIRKNQAAYCAVQVYFLKKLNERKQNALIRYKHTKKDQSVKSEDQIVSTKSYF